MTKCAKGTRHFSREVKEEVVMYKVIRKQLPKLK